MSEDSKEPPSSPPPAPVTRKLPYEAPAIISEQVFETLALSCQNARFVCPPSGAQS